MTRAKNRGHSARQPFHIVPWDCDFLEAVLQLALRLTRNRPGDAVLVFPHGRPRRHLIDRLRNAPGVPKPCLLPQMYTVQELFTRIRAEREQRPPQTVGLLDRVGLLLECVTDLASPGTPLCEALTAGGQRHFFPWGARLSALLEDCFSQGLRPDDLTHMEGQVAPFAASLLENLGRIHERYTLALMERGWSTPGFDAFRAVDGLEGTPSCLEGRTVIIAGFAALNGTEERLFEHLWRHCGADICLHTDAAVARMGQERVHWTCEDHVRWLTSWRAEAELLHAPRAFKPRVSFCEGYDLHSQLHELGTLLQNTEDLSSTAVVLPDTGLLMPVLHHLPTKAVNISMGYPLVRSTLFRLLETLMRLQETRGSNGLYHWRECIDLIRHPYLKMLEVEGTRPLPEVFHMVEDRLRGGTRFADLATVMEEALAETDVAPGTQDLCRTLLDLCLSRWERASTPAALAEAVGFLCAVLLERGGDLWERFPIDAECLFRLMQRVIPALRESELAATAFPQDVLFTILRETVRAERVPFEADPIGGLQVLGMLESRLLTFRRVIVLDATDDRLPGAPPNDPLLPDSLRPQVGLPDARRRERITAHNFHRLLAGAEEVNLLWQAGVERSGLLDDKKARSRFVEEMLWHEERAAGRLFRPGEGPLGTVTCTVRPFESTPRHILKTDAVRDALARFFERPVSPSRLDAYLTCPFRFYHEHLCRLAPPDEVIEGEDPAAVGTLLHEALNRFYAPWRGIEVTRDRLDPEMLERHFRQSLHESGLADRFPADALAMLETAGPERLRRFLARQPDRTVVLHLEEAFTADVEVDGRTRRLGGRLDRVDRRGEGAVVLDYKTGSLRTVRPDVWEDHGLWERVRTWEPAADRPLTGQDEGSREDLLDELARRMPSVQLPCYIHLYGQATGEDVHDAAWVELRDSGDERPLFGDGCDDAVRDEAISRHIPDLMRFLLRHMELAPAFVPRHGRHCDWCSCRKLCRV